MVINILTYAVNMCGQIHIHYWHTLHLGCLWGYWILYKPYAFSSGLPVTIFFVYYFYLQPVKWQNNNSNQIKSIICWVNKHLQLLCYYLRILFPFLPYGIIFGVSCDFKSQLAFEWEMLPVTLKDIELKKVTEMRLIVWKSRIHSTFHN